MVLTHGRSKVSSVYIRLCITDRRSLGTTAAIAPMVIRFARCTLLRDARIRAARAPDARSGNFTVITSAKIRTRISLPLVMPTARWKPGHACYVQFYSIGNGTRQFFEFKNAVISLFLLDSILKYLNIATYTCRNNSNFSVSKVNTFSKYLGRT